MNKEIEYVITHMAAERGKTPDQIQSIIEEAIHAGVTSKDPLLSGGMISKFVCWKLSAGEFIEEIEK